MSLETNVSSAFTRVATEFKTLRTQLTGNNSGSLAGLTTTAKSSLIAAINELDAAIEALAGAEGGATIDDGATSSLTVWSSSKTDTEIDAAVAALVDAAPGALNTLNELAAALGDDPNFASTLTASIAGKVSLTGNETIAGVKTFSSSPVVPDGSFTIAKTTGLQTALDGKQPLDSDLTAVAGLASNGMVVRTGSGTAAARSVAVTAGTGIAVTNGDGVSGNPTLAGVDASATAKGVVELATDAEAIAGTDAGRAVTPANLAAYVGDPNEDFVTTFESGLA